MLYGEATGRRSYGYSPECTLRAGLLEGQEKGNQRFKVGVSKFLLKICRHQIREPLHNVCFGCKDGPQKEGARLKIATGRSRRSPCQRWSHDHEPWGRGMTGSAVLCEYPLTAGEIRIF